MAEHEMTYGTATGNDYAEHESTYRTFVGLVKWSSIAIAVILVFMAVFLL